MLGSILSSIGGSIGKSLGGGILSTIGRYAGNRLGNYLEKKWFSRSKTRLKVTNARDSFHIAKAEYGNSIPLVFGRMRVPGQIIWVKQVTANRHAHTTSKYFKKNRLTLNTRHLSWTYNFTFAMVICEGEIAEIARVWLDDKLIDLRKYKFKLYKGDEEQMPDPVMSANSKEPIPAYRGIAYIVFYELPLADFDDTIPIFSFEVTRKASLNQDASVEDLVKAMTMIPGSGEYVYDTIKQQKIILARFGSEIRRESINSHNHYNIANSIHSLDQLQMTCQNIEWVSPVVCWFGNSVDAKECIIRPGFEFNQDNIKYTEEWRVGRYVRDNAYQISRDEHNNPNYGGSVNDGSVVRYLIEIKRRNLKVMFYPMFFLDVPRKPWRGRVTSAPEHIRNFFRREQGYNEFILHYAHLVKNHVDGFVIGSELIGLTKVRDGSGFPAVEELVNLARMVKEIVGPNVVVTYAADWSEYHHTEGGWFNLDPLWASPDIDVVGIDAYFPVTKASSTIITPEEIAEGWRSGEGYDYYIDGRDGSQHPLEPKYAWKNLRYWWEHTHQNPDGQNTQWQPRSKPIWFTEFGFPSIDKATNQPNVFFDPACIDGGVPRHSSGDIDFSVQRKAIRAFLEYWKTQEYIGQMFLWTWDARPYPAWPHMKIWSDGRLWEKGHWVNNKFGSSNVASIVLEISARCEIDIAHIEAASVDEPVEGFLLSNQITALNAINILRAAHFFDICANDGKKISFIKRGHKQEIKVDVESCLKLSDNSFIEEAEIPQDIAINKIDLYFLDKNKNYETNYVYVNNEHSSYSSKAKLRLPLAMSQDDAKRVGHLILSNAAIEDRVIKFILSESDIRLKPADFVILKNGGKTYSIRVIETHLADARSLITGIIDSRFCYFGAPVAQELQLIANEYNIEKKLVPLDLPFMLGETDEPYIAIYLQNNNEAPLYSKMLGTNWAHVANLTPTKAIARLLRFDHNERSNIFMIDEDSEIILSATALEEYISNNWQYAMIGSELVSFKNLEKTGEGIYKISNLARGQIGTDAFMNNHNEGEDFVILNTEFNILPVSVALINQQVDFKSCGIEKSITYKNKAQAPLLPYITQQALVDNELRLKWVPRTRNPDDWQEAGIIPEQEFTIQIIDGGIVHEQRTRALEINIDISQMQLSAEYRVSIII